MKILFKHFLVFNFEVKKLLSFCNKFLVRKNHDILSFSKLLFSPTILNFTNVIFQNTTDMLDINGKLRV